MSVSRNILLTYLDLAKIVNYDSAYRGFSFDQLSYFAFRNSEKIVSRKCFHVERELCANEKYRRSIELKLERIKVSKSSFSLSSFCTLLLYYFYYCIFYCIFIIEVFIYLIQAI